MDNIISYILQIDVLEAAGLLFGLLAVYYLIRENSLTWPSGIIYVLVSFVIFWRAKLYADFGLHIVFLVLNIYGWWYWKGGSKNEQDDIPITKTSTTLQLTLWTISGVGIFIMGSLLHQYSDAALPYWDSATTVLSLTGMWLTARKKIENWHFWLVVDVLATGIYFYKGIHFYALLYLIYIILAVIGFVTWNKTMKLQKA